MKKVKNRNHQEWRRDKLSFFHLPKDMVMVVKAAFNKNKCRS